MASYAGRMAPPGYPNTSVTPSRTRHSQRICAPVRFIFYSEGLRPSNSPTRSLARRFAGSLRSRGSLAVARSLVLTFHCLFRGASPLELPYTLTRSPLRRLAPFAWLTRCRSFARPYVSLFISRGFAPPTPLHAHSLAASPARSVRVAHSLSLVRSSLRFIVYSEGLRPSNSPTRSLARRFAGSLRSRGSLAVARSLVLTFHCLFRGASPLELPYTLTRSPLRRLAPFAWLTRCRSFARPYVSLFIPRGFAPRTPLHAHSLAASPARSVRVAHSLSLVRSSLRFIVYSEGLRPSNSPTRSLARRFAGSLRSRGSLAVARSLVLTFHCLFRGASPLELPYTLTRSPLRRLAPFAWLTRCRSFARPYVSLFIPRGFAPRTPLHAHSLAASPARSVRVAHSLSLVRSSLRFIVYFEGLRPSNSPTRSLARRFAGSLRSRGSLAVARSLVLTFHCLFRGASPLELPYTLTRSPLRRLAPFAWLTRCRSFARPYVSLFISRGFAPPTPLHAHSLAASPARSVRVAHSLSLVRSSLRFIVYSEGLRPSNSPTRSLARRFAGSLRSRGSLAVARSLVLTFHCLFRGASPLQLPYTLTRSPLRRLAPFAWLTRCRSFARPYVSLFIPRGFAPPTPLHAHSLAASPARSVRVAHSLSLVRSSLRFIVYSEGLRPSNSPTRSLA